MITVATLAAYILAIAQPVAAECERDRLLQNGDTTTLVVESMMPKPSSAWAVAWASQSMAVPLLGKDLRAEAIVGNVFAYGESLYQDTPKRSDGGDGVCSLGVHWKYTPWTADELEQDPAKCVTAARTAMRWSFSLDANHPFNRYAGCGRYPCPIADRRTAIVKRLAAKLPPLKEDPS